MKVKVLIFPAGEINSIELHDSLSHNVNVEVYGAASVDRHGPYVFERYRGNLPYISDCNFVEEFNNLINEWKIDFVFPTHDTVALFLASRRTDIDAEIIVSSLKTAEICRDKKQTYDLFSDCHFCPIVYEKIEVFPCFIKPREGQGARGSRLIRNRMDIPSSVLMSEYVISEYLPGEEITVDCLTDSHGKLAAVLPRVRKRIMAGVCVAGFTIDLDEEIKNIAETINDRLDFLGLWYFQLKKDIYGKYKLLEISTRCSGTMCLSRARGVNLPLLSGACSIT